MIDKNFKKIFQNIAREYDQNFQNYGDNPKSTGQRNTYTQERRLSVLMEVGNLERAKILDFGCGTGLLGEQIRKHIKFKILIGIDISKGMLEKSKSKKIYDTLYCFNLWIILIS